MTAGEASVDAAVDDTGRDESWGGGGRIWTPLAAACLRHRLGARLYRRLVPRSGHGGPLQLQLHLRTDSLSAGPPTCAGESPDRQTRKGRLDLSVYPRRVHLHWRPRRLGRGVRRR